MYLSLKVFRPSWWGSCGGDAWPELERWFPNLTTLESPGELFKNTHSRASLVAQCLRIHLPTQGTCVQVLVQEDPTCRGATKPVCHNY